MGEIRTDGAKARSRRIFMATVIVMAAMAAAATASKEGLDERINAYAKADGNAEAVISQNFTLNALVNIPKPKTAGATITISSVNPAAPAVIKRGISGNLFNVHDGATLILKDIIIDGDCKGLFKDGGGQLIRVNKGGTLVMNDGAIVRNNTSKPGGGSGVHVPDGAFIMTGGEISGNTTGNDGGGTHIYNGTFTMTGGKISGNTADNSGGGVRLSSGAKFTMTGGEISGNAADIGDGVYAASGSTFNLYGGTVTGNGGAATARNLPVYVSDDSKYNLNNGGAPAPNNAVVNVLSKSIAGLVVLVDFPDARSTITREDLNDFFNKKGGAKGGPPISVYDYFYEFSNGRLEFTGIVSPLFTLPHNGTYYDSIYASNHNAFGEAVFAYVIDKLNEIKFDPSGITVDNKNKALALSILYVGKGTRFPAWGGTFSGGPTLNGISFRGRQFTRIEPGQSPFNSNTLGVCLHEIGHIIGWEHIGQSAMKRCIMHSGFIPNPYIRHKYGWTDAVDITNAPAGTVFSIEANSHKTYVYRRNAKEAYYIDARRRAGGGAFTYHEQRRLESGLAIWHYHGNASEFKDDDFKIKHIDRTGLDLIHADGRNDPLQNGVDWGDETDLFRLGVKTRFNSKTVPAAVWHDGAPSGLSISRISDTGAVMTFKIGDEDYEDAVFPKYRLLDRVMRYRTAGGNIEAVVDENLELDMPVNIPKPQKAGATLTIRGANPAKPVILTRGAKGHLFTVYDGATLILENIIIDGSGSINVDGNDVLDENGKPANTGKPADSNVALVKVNKGGTLVLNGGTIVGTGKNIAAVVSGEHKLNNDAVIIAWNKPSDNAPLNYSAGTSTHLSVLPDKAATAVWAIRNDRLGILYGHGANAGFIEIDEKGVFRAAPVHRAR